MYVLPLQEKGYMSPLPYVVAILLAVIGTIGIGCILSLSSIWQ